MALPGQAGGDHHLGALGRLKPDGSFQTGMNSFNHYAYGAVGEWMVRVASPASRPRSGSPGTSTCWCSRSRAAAFTSAEARLQTLYGEAASGWALADGRVTVTATVPPNARGTIRLPVAMLAGVTEGGLAVASAPA